PRRARDQPQREAPGRADRRAAHVSRIIVGKMRLEQSVVDWAEIVRAAVEVTQPAAVAKQIEIGVSIDRSVGPFYGDGAPLQQIVWNLLTNAVKFTPESGSVRVRLRQ